MVGAQVVAQLVGGGVVGVAGELDHRVAVVGGVVGAAATPTQLVCEEDD